MLWGKLMEISRAVCRYCFNVAVCKRHEGEGIEMFSEVAGFLFGPFCYPLYFASFLHAVDLFVNITGPRSTDSEPRSPLVHATGKDFEVQFEGEPKEMR